MISLIKAFGRVSPVSGEQSFLAYVFEAFIQVLKVVKGLWYNVNVDLFKLTTRNVH